MAALYTQESIDRLKEAVDMVQLVSAKTDLRRVGSRWVGLCPFHDERTPSFSVDAERALYHCFGCAASGDAIKFVRETEALEFPEAVEVLADRHGIELQRENEDPRAEERRRRRERLLSLLERATRFYSTYLWESEEAKPARDYLTGRGLSEEVLREFRVGYSPGAWERLSAGARRDGFRDEELLAGGVAQRGRGGGLYDRFRGRIMFPLADARGRVLGFGARAMGDAQGPKYLNTSENELYHKGRQLFGIDLAKPHSTKAGRMVVVEGYTDVLALRQAGIPEAVAIMGTSLTEDQLAELSKAARTVYLALDADRAGQEAMLKAARAARDRDVELRVIDMPAGKDPAELIAAEGSAAFAPLIERAMPVPQFEVRRVIADADLETPSGRDRALGEARPLIAGTPDRSALRDELVRYVSDRLDVPVDYVTAQLGARGRPQGAGGDSRERSTPTRTVGGASLAAERAFLQMCAASGDVGRDFLTKLDDRHLSSEVMRRARDVLVSRFDDPLADLPQDDPALAAVLTGIALARDDEEQAATEPMLRMSLLQLEWRSIERELREAREARDLPRQHELAGARQRVRSEIDVVMGQTA